MIFGRPANLWLSAIQGVWAALAVLANVPGSPLVGLANYLTPVVWGVVSIALSGIMAVVAYQPPTLNPGDAYTVVTAPGQPNVSKVANTNVTPIPPNAGVTDEGINP